MATIITPSEVPKYVPGAVTAASDDLGWSGVCLRGYRYTGLDVIVPPVRDFTIVSYLRGATFMERRCEGAWTKTHCAPGDVSLLTRSQRSHWHWTEEIDVSHVYLSENLVSGICAEVTDRSLADVRLRDVLKSQDPIVTAAVAAIKREAQQQALGSGLYVEAVATQLAVHLLRKYASVTFREPSAKGRLSPSQVRNIGSRLEEIVERAVARQKGKPARSPPQPADLPTHPGLRCLRRAKAAWRQVPSTAATRNAFSECGSRTECFSQGSCTS
jgi:AraC family transcriptional regulator